MPKYIAGLEVRSKLPVLSVGLYLEVGLKGIGWDEAKRMFFDTELGVCRWPYLGLPKLDAMTYVEGDNLLGVGLSSLMRVTDDNKPKLKARALQRIAEATVTQYRRNLLMEIVEAYLKLHGPHLDQYKQLLLTEKYQMVRQLGKTTREEGIEEGRRATIREQLEAKYGTLDATARRRLEEMSLEKLREIAPLVLTKSLAELGLTDHVNGTTRR